MESESWKRLSFCVVGRKLRVPTAPIVVPSNGAFTFEMRGRSSADPVNRRSFTKFELNSLVYCKVPLWSESFSVPSFETALFVKGLIAPPTVTAFTSFDRE